MGEYKVRVMSDGEVAAQGIVDLIPLLLPILLTGGAAYMAYQILDVWREMPWPFNYVLIYYNFIFVAPAHYLDGAFGRIMFFVWFVVIAPTLYGGIYYGLKESGHHFIAKILAFGPLSYLILTVLVLFSVNAFADILAGNFAVNYDVGLMDSLDPSTKIFILGANIFDTVAFYFLTYYKIVLSFFGVIPYFLIEFFGDYFVSLVGTSDFFHQLVFINEYSNETHLAGAIFHFVNALYLIFVYFGFKVWLRHHEASYRLFMTAILSPIGLFIMAALLFLLIGFVWNLFVGIAANV